MDSLEPRISPLLVALLALTGCTAAPPPERVSDDLLLAVASIDGLVRWHEDVLLVCDTPRGEDAAPCRVELVSPDARRSDPDVGPALAAERLSGGRLAILRPDRRLVVRDADGQETELATSVFDPRVSSDLERVLFREAFETETDEVSRLVEVHATTLARRILTEDPEASTAFDVPGDERALFVSTRTGLASLFLEEPDGTERQLTNVGVGRVGPDVVPVPTRQLAWVDDGRAFVFTAHSASGDVLHRVELGDGRATVLGPGRFPIALGGDRIKGVDRSESGSPWVVRYPVEAR